MRVSTDWIKQYIGAELPPIDVLTAKVGAQLGAIEAIENLGNKYAGIPVVKVISCEKHPDSDHLHVCRIDDGGKVANVERDEHGYVQVVCGAANVHADMFAVWLAPGMTVPESVGKDPFVLGRRNLRGVVSNGMLASARELALGDNHEGILDVDAKDVHPGDDFASLYGLGDYVIDIENKMFTHRPDCFGQLGVAREVAGILGIQFASPSWYLAPDSDAATDADTSLSLRVQNELPQLVPRFVAVTMQIGKLAPSPVWLQTRLSRVGVRSINNVVDVTNYMMLVTGQPLHAYDYDKVRALSGDDGATLVVRYPRPGERIKLLNGKEIEPRSEAIMIATDKQLVGVGGVMGGGDTEVDDSTQRIILECATFDMFSIRRTSMAHGLFTDAVTRFNKGQSPLQNVRVVGESMRLLGEIAGAKRASAVIDENHVGDRAWVHPPVPITVDYINARLGIHLAAQDIQRVLRNVEFQVEDAGGQLTVTAPFWRTDIELREDVVEEVGRLYGFDHLPLELPTRDLTPALKDVQLSLKSVVRERLSRAGANEVLTYSFVHGDLIDKVGQDREQAFRLSNALSPDLQYYRLSLTPSLLDHVHANMKAGYDQFALFEQGLIHHREIMDTADDNVPLEDGHVALVFSASDKVAAHNYAGAAYYEARAYLEALMSDIDAPLVPLKDFDFKTDAWGRQLCAPYEPNRAAVLVRDGLAWGVVGEFRASVVRALKLPAYTSGFEIGLSLIDTPSKGSYIPLPRFPKIEQDLCLRVASTMSYNEVFRYVEQAVNKHKPELTLTSLSPVDIYQAANDAAHKQITLRLHIASYERTLTDIEVSKLLDVVASAAHDSFGADKI